MKGKRDEVKDMKTKKIWINAILLIGVMALISTALSLRPVYAAPPVDSIWIEPSTLNFDISKHPVGYKFNVTVMLSVSTKKMFSWQFKLYYDSSQLTALRAGYTAGATSQWATKRTGGGTSSVSPVVEKDYVLFSESCVGDNYVPAGTTASLAWVEFKIAAAPPAGGKLQSLLSIDNADTWVLDENLNEITVGKSGSSYTIVPEFGFIAILVTLITATGIVVIAKKKGYY
ncbi:MAG: cohesin domain-containing protein [Candidatus Bathyarchaeia archaeon]